MPSDVAQKIKQQFSKYPLRTYAKGQILIFAEEDPEHVFYLVKGNVLKYDVSYRGHEVIVTIFKPNAFFPMSYALNRTPNKYFYKTETDTVLHVVPIDDALAFVKENPDVLIDLLSRLYEGVDGILGRIVHLMSGTAQSRLMYELIIECHRFSKDNGTGSYILSSSEVDIAARSGLSRETVNREMHKLKESGFVTISNEGILVTDISAMQKRLGLEI